MFSNFQKKKVDWLPIECLELEDRAFVDVVSHFADAPLNCGTMSLIAYINYKPFMDATFAMAREKPDQDIPRDLDSLIRFTERGISKQRDEVASRRRQWYYAAGLIHRYRAIIEPALIDSLAGLWSYLAHSGSLLEQVMANNILWEDKEKNWFDGILTPQDGVKYVLVVWLPSVFMGHPKIQALAREYDVLLS